jgi:hypothetical protein
MDQEFLQILEEYERLKRVDYVSANINSINEEVFCWKTRLLNFLEQYKEVDSEKKSKITEMQQNIMQKKAEIDNLSRIEYAPSPDKLQLFTAERLEQTITDLFIFGNKDSNSASLILRGRYECNPVFLKVFDSENSRLNRELKLYQHIYRAKESLDVSVKPYIDGCFIKLKLAFSINKEEFFNFLERRRIEQIKKEVRKLYYSTGQEDSVIKEIPKIFTSELLYFIVTEDIGEFTLRGFFDMCESFTKRRETVSNYRLDLLGADIQKEIINLLFEVFYSIYVLNHYLKILHEDLHFRNIILQKRDSPIIKIFIIGNLKIEKISNWRVAIFDFDKSVIDDEQINGDVKNFFTIKKLFLQYYT